jgi:hypothetical protein
MLRVSWQVVCVRQSLPGGIVTGTAWKPEFYLRACPVALWLGRQPSQRGRLNGSNDYRLPSGIVTGTCPVAAKRLGSTYARPVAL